jgi:hypothetical protein
VENWSDRRPGTKVGTLTIRVVQKMGAGHLRSFCVPRE